MAHCRSCGSQLVEGAKFCSDCGAAQTAAADNQGAFASGQTEAITRALKKKKPFYKKWWFWLLVPVVLLTLYMAAEDMSESEFQGANDKKAETGFKDSGGVPLPASAIAFAGRMYFDVVAELQSAGFDNVKSEPVYDVLMATADQDGLVAAMTVNGSETFDAKQVYPKNTAIAVTYHSMIEMPMSGEAFDLGDYQSAVAELKKAGFNNIKTKGLGDLIISLLHSEGDVKDITANGVAGFASGARYPKDVPILLTYHSNEASEEYAAQPDEADGGEATTSASPMKAILAPLQEKISSAAAATTTAAATTSTTSTNTTTTAKPATIPATTKAAAATTRTTATRAAAPANPPANQDEIVYWGQTGNKIHRSEYCRTFKYTPYSGTIAQANAAGHYGWCGVCS